MWLRRDAEYLYLGLRHELEPGLMPQPKGNAASWWGEADIMEIIFEGAKSILENNNPRFVEDKLSAFAAPRDRRPLS